jgi:hypothetical protein
MRSPLTETIKRVEGMIAYVRENLDEGEYDLFLDLILPEPEPVKAVKKGRKRAGKGGSKSSRASGMAAAINRSLESSRQAATKDDSEDDGFCAACNVQMGDNVHHLESLPDYHPFQSKSDAVAHEAGAGG